MRELERVSLRVEDLRKKVVTSPDKLKANLSRLQQQVNDVVATTRDMAAQQKMWEALTSQGQQIPEVRGGALGGPLIAHIFTLLTTVPPLSTIDARMLITCLFPPGGHQSSE